jgi:hypothetical protein
MPTKRTSTSLYHNAFLLSTLRDWNSLTRENQNSSSLSPFKTQLKVNFKIPKWYYIGGRKWQVSHTRLWTECSFLNNHISRKNMLPHQIVHVTSWKVTTTISLDVSCIMISDSDSLMLFSYLCTMTPLTIRRPEY